MIGKRFALYGTTFVVVAERADSIVLETENGTRVPLAQDEIHYLIPLGD